MCSNVLQPNPPYISLSLIKTMFPELPFCKPPKNPIFITGLSKEQYFSPSYVGFLDFFVSVRVFSQRKQESENLLTPSPLLSFLGLSFPISFFLSRFVPSSLTPHPTPPTFFFLSFSPFPFSLRLFFPFGFSCFSLIS